MRFIWDYNNITHIGEHGITPGEVEFALLHRTVEVDYQDWHDSEERFGELGITATGRILYIVTAERDGGLRVVTAYDAPKHLILEYLGSR